MQFPKDIRSILYLRKLLAVSILNTDMEFVVFKGNSEKQQVAVA